ncbi:MAG: TonB-dependent receptor [Halioglobus sp.]|nr:TonB-dependent receptor [Halioglobus sp.]
MNTMKKWILASLAAQYLMIGPQLARAQMLEEVLVTARKKTESLTDAPLAVSVVDGDLLNREGITNMEQLSGQVPGLQLGRAALSSSIYIRGIGSSTNAGFEQSAGMYVDGIYQPRSRQFTQSLIDLNRIEILRGPQSLLFGKNTVAGAIKVETADPGLDEDLGGYILADVEPEYSTARGTAVVSGALSETVAARLALRYQQTDGYVDNVYIDEDVQRADDTIGRLSLVWAPVEQLRVVGKLARTEMHGKGIEQVNPVADPNLLDETLAGNTMLELVSVAGSIAAFDTPGFQAATGSREYKSWTGNLDWESHDKEKTTSSQASLRADWEADRFTLTSLSGYTNFNFKQRHDVDFHPGNVVQGSNRESLDFFSQEFRVASDLDGFFNFTAGLYYEDQNLDTGAQAFVDGTLGGLVGGLLASSLNPALPPVPLSSLGINSLWNGTVLAQLDPSVGGALIGAEQDAIQSRVANQGDNRTTSAFAEFNFELSDTVSFDIGGRWSEDRKKMSKMITLGSGSPANPVLVIDSNGVPTGALDAKNTELVAVAGSALSIYPSDQKLKLDESHFDPSYRLRWDALENTMVYLSYSEGYKSGGFNPSPDTSNPDGSAGEGTEFKPEEAQAWELGAKSSFWDNRARLAATLFHTRVDDLQVTSWQGTSFIVGNAASMTSQGMELEGQFAVSSEWELGGAIAYLDSEFDDYDNAPCTVYQTAEQGPSCLQDLGGERGPFAPEWSGVVYASYQRAVWGNHVFKFYTNASYTDDYFLDGDLDPNTRQDSYVKINASVAIAAEGDRWEVSLYGRNLTDETTYTYATDAPLSAGIYGGWVAEPRIIGVQGLYNF